MLRMAQCHAIVSMGVLIPILRQLKLVAEFYGSIRGRRCVGVIPSIRDAGDVDANIGELKSKPRIRVAKGQRVAPPTIGVFVYS